MSHYKSILLAVDVFEDNTQLLKRATDIIKAFGAKWQLAYVLPNLVTNVPYAVNFRSDIEQDAITRLEAIRQQLKLAQDAVHLLHGNAKDQVPALALSLKADLIITGSHGKHGLELLLGSTANGIVHMAQCDVLTLRLDQKNQCLQKHYKNILLATDLEADCKGVAKTAKTVAAQFKATLHAVNVVANTTATAISYYPNIELELRDDAEKKIKQQAKHYGVTAEHAHAVIGLPKVVITELAADQHCELIVIGSHGRSEIASMLLGSTANAVLHDAQQDVLVVRIKK
jgi:universal stress protein A